MRPKGDDFVKSLNLSFSVIPAKAGIQCFQYFWMPASADMTKVRIFYEPVKVNNNTRWTCSSTYFHRRL